MDEKKGPAGRTWKILKDEPVESFRIFEFRKSTRVSPRSGAEATYFLMRGLNWSNVIALTPENEVVLVRQYRHGIDQYTIELPGGCVEADDSDPGISALRELEEETGYTADPPLLLGSVYANPAMQSQIAYSYLSRNARLTSAQNLDPGEDIEIILQPLSKVIEMVRSGEIKHSIMVSAFAHLLLSREKLGL